MTIAKDVHKIKWGGFKQNFETLERLKFQMCMGTCMCTRGII